MIGSMKVDKQLMFGCFLQQTFLKVDDQLVVTVKKIDFQPGYSPFLKLCQSLWHLSVQRMPYAP